MKALVAEDQFSLRHWLSDCLTDWGYEVVAAADGHVAWKLLQGPDAPRLAILDWMMPGIDGLEICERVRRCPGGSYVYLILLTGRSDQQDLLSGLEAGANEYLVKPVDERELRVRLHTARRILDLQEQLVAAHETQRYAATHDALTGLWNRSAVLDALDREVARANRGGPGVGVLLADIDHFKSVNDTHGHLAGDAVLREVSRRLGQGLRPYDTLGRYGGEEFLAVLPGCDPGSAGGLAERLRRQVGAGPVSLVDGNLPVNASFGATASHPGRPTTSHALLHAADQALYRAKRSGRNRVVVYGVPPPLRMSVSNQAAPLPS